MTINLNVVWQAHKKLEGLDKTEAIEKAIELSKETLTYEGLFFNVKVHTVENHIWIPPTQIH